MSESENKRCAAQAQPNPAGSGFIHATAETVGVWSKNIFLLWNKERRDNRWSGAAATEQRMFGLDHHDSEPEPEPELLSGNHGFMFSKNMSSY